MRFEVLGVAKIPPGAPCVFAANHRSHFDIPALLAALPTARFAAKQELFAKPLLGAVMRSLGIIPIDRDNPETAKRALDEAARRPGGGGSLIIFPEGEEAEPGQMLPFGAGAFVFALRTGIPVVPVAIHNTAAILPRGDALAISAGRVVVEALEPIGTLGLGVEDRAQLAAAVRAALVNALRPCDGGSAGRADLGRVLGGRPGRPAHRLVQMEAEARPAPRAGSSPPRSSHCPVEAPRARSTRPRGGSRAGRPRSGRAAAPRAGSACAREALDVDAELAGDQQRDGVERHAERALGRLGQRACVAGRQHHNTSRAERDRGRDGRVVRDAAVDQVAAADRDGRKHGRDRGAREHGVHRGARGHHHLLAVREVSCDDVAAQRRAREVDHRQVPREEPAQAARIDQVAAQPERAEPALHERDGEHVVAIEAAPDVIELATPRALGPPA